MEKRVSLLEVQLACEKNGFHKPLKGTWAACPLGQLAHAENARDHIAWAEERFGKDYVMGFVFGFDCPKAEAYGERVKAGLEDGAKVREAYYPTPARYYVA